MSFVGSTWLIREKTLRRWLTAYAMIARRIERRSVAVPLPRRSVRGLASRRRGV